MLEKSAELTINKSGMRFILILGAAAASHTTSIVGEYESSEEGKFKKKNHPLQHDINII